MTPATELATTLPADRFVPTVRTLAIFLGGLFAVLLIRLYAVQVRAPERAVDRATAQMERAASKSGSTLVEKIPRAPILDRTGRVLAESWFVHDLVVNPEAIARRHPGLEAAQLAEDTFALIHAALAGAKAAPHGDLRASLHQAFAEQAAGRPRQWLLAAKELTPKQRRVVREALELARVPAVSFEDRLVRSYPFGAVTSQVVGVVGEDERDGKGRIAGRAGVELQLDAILEASPGAFAAQKDAAGRELLPEWILAREPAPGATVVLTVDAEIQRICLEELEKGVRKTEATKASAIVLSAHTGEVLAACTWPSADPAKLARDGMDRLKLSAFVDLYEPGSTMKPLFVSWALQSKVVTFSSTFDCGGPKGYQDFGQRRVREYIANPGLLTTESILIKSSNVGACRIGFERLKLPGMYDALEAYRVAGRPELPFPIPTGNYYTPRATGVNKGVWTGCSFPQGYEIMLSPLGLARLFLCYARYGEMIEPSLVRELRTADGDTIPAPPAAAKARRVVDRDIMTSLARVLERVVEEGTGKNARSAKWSIAGKTGTPKIGQSNLYNPVFCGFAPVRGEGPEIVVVVQQHRVRGRGHGTYTGGAVSAPIGKEIIERTLGYLGVPPEEGRPEKPAPRD